MDSRGLEELKLDGWYEVNHVGSHKQFKPLRKIGRVTVPHPKRDIPIGTLRSLEKQAGIKLRRFRSQSWRTTMEYIGYLHKDSKFDFGVSFPDFPGCVTAGKTLEEARRMAAEL